MIVRRHPMRMGDCLLSARLRRSEAADVDFANVLIDEGGQAGAGEGEMLDDLHLFFAGSGVVIAIAFSVAKFDVDGGLVESEGTDASVGFAAAVALHALSPGAFRIAKFSLG